MSGMSLLQEHLREHQLQRSSTRAQDNSKRIQDEARDQLMQMPLRKDQRWRKRKEMWGTLPSKTTDDPNFRPTFPLPERPQLKKRLLQSRMSRTEFRAANQATIYRPDSSIQLKKKVVSMVEFEGMLE